MALSLSLLNEYSLEGQSKFFFLFRLRSVHRLLLLLLLLLLSLLLLSLS